MDGFELQYRVIHGYRRAFIHAGQGPALLFIHGIGDRSDTWRAVLERLARDYTVIAPDLLGHGRSDKPRADYSVGAYANGMRDLLSVLDVERATIIGHSLGGGVALQFAYQYPDRCERLVLVGSGGVCREVHPALRLAAAPVGSDIALPLLEFKFMRELVRHAIEWTKRRGTGLGRDADHVLQVLDALPDATARQAFLRTVRGVIDTRGQVITMLDRCYLTAGMPTLLMWGTHDPIIPFRHALVAHGAMPGSRLEAFEGRGHFPHRDDPDRFVAVLRDFLESTAPSTFNSQQWRELLRRGKPSGPVPLAAPSAQAQPQPITTLPKRRAQALWSRIQLRVNTAASA